MLFSPLFLFIIHSAAGGQPPNYLPRLGSPFLNASADAYLQSLYPKDRQLLWTRVFASELPLPSRFFSMMLHDLREHLYRECRYIISLDYLFINLQEYLLASKNGEEES
jgi:hypothetical protein